MEPADVVRGMFEDFRGRGDELGGVWNVPEPERQEVVRRVLAEVFERWTHPDVEYREDPAWPGAATYIGRDAVIDVFSDYVLVLGLESPELLEAVEGPKGIAIAVRISASRPDSEQVVGHTWGYLCQVEGDRLRSFWAYVNPDEAFAAAGVERGAA